jgi:hypothetical protein
MLSLMMRAAFNGLNHEVLGGGPERLTRGVDREVIRDVARQIHRDHALLNVLYREIMGEISPRTLSANIPEPTILGLRYFLWGM